MEAEKDPLAFAKWQHKRYSMMGTTVTPPPPEKKIVLESARPTSRPTRTKPARAGEPWEDGERMLLVRAWLAQEHIGDIAMKVQRSQGSVLAQLRQIGFEID